MNSNTPNAKGRLRAKTPNDIYRLGKIAFLCFWEFKCLMVAGFLYRLGAETTPNFPPFQVSLADVGFSAGVGIPPTPDRGPNPHFLEKRVSGSKNPHFPSPLQRLEKGVFGPKIPIFYVFPCRKKGICSQKTPFSTTRGNGSFRTPKPSIRAPVWGQGNPNAGGHIYLRHQLSMRRSQLQLFFTEFIPQSCNPPAEHPSDYNYISEPQQDQVCNNYHLQLRVLIQ